MFTFSMPSKFPVDFISVSFCGAFGFQRFYCSMPPEGPLISPSLNELFGEDISLSEQDNCYLNLVIGGSYILTCSVIQAILCSFCYFFIMLNDENLTSEECQSALRFFSTLDYYGRLGIFTPSYNNFLLECSALFVRMFISKGYYNILPVYEEGISLDYLLDCYIFPFITLNRDVPFYFNSDGLISIDHCCIPFSLNFLKELLSVATLSSMSLKDIEIFVNLLNTFYNSDDLDGLYYKCIEKTESFEFVHHKFYFLLLLNQSALYLGISHFYKSQFLNGVVFGPFLF